MAFFSGLLLLIILLLICNSSSSTSLAESAGWVGVNYGRIADNLPPPEKVVELLKDQGIDRIKLFDTDPAVLTALSNSNISVVVALPNELLSSVASSSNFSDNWVHSKLISLPIIQAIAVGNKVFMDPNNTTRFLVPAMENLYSSLQKYNLHNSIKVSSPIALSALASSYPTSFGSFKPDLVEPVIKPMLHFLHHTQSYLMLNVYPFFAYAANPDHISLDYALFRDNPGVVDSDNGLKYSCIFEAQVTRKIRGL